MGAIDGVAIAAARVGGAVHDLPAGVNVQPTPALGGHVDKKAAWMDDQDHGREGTLISIPSGVTKKSMTFGK